MMAMHDRYYEHIQPALFLREHYPASTVVVDDIGAVAYYTDCRLLDMYGLGDMEPVRYRMSESGYTRDNVENWANKENAEIAILQTGWQEIGPRIPNSWRQVADWIIPRNVIFGDTQIALYAVKPAVADDLTSRILAFRPRLPDGMQVEVLADTTTQTAACAR